MSRFVPRRPLAGFAVLAVSFALACGDSDDGKTNGDTSTTGSTTWSTSDGGAGDGGGGGGGGGGTGACESTNSALSEDARYAVGEVCTHFMECGLGWYASCEECVEQWEYEYLAQDSYSQARWPEVALCFSTISCSDLAAGDFSDCYADTCGGVYCGTSHSTCQYYGCGGCGGDGYCYY